MFLGGLFKRVKSILPDEVRTIIKEKSASEYCLLDVRQPGEYEQGHIPGAKLIPLGALHVKIDMISTDILDLMMALEANTLDLYLKLGREVKSERAGSAFTLLAEEETRRLKKLATVFEKTL